LFTDKELLSTLHVELVLFCGLNVKQIFIRFLSFQCPITGRYRIHYFFVLYRNFSDEAKTFEKNCFFFGKKTFSLILKTAIMSGDD